MAPKQADVSQKKLISFEEMPALYNIQKCPRIIFHLNNYLHLYIRRDGRRKIFVQCSENILRFNN